MEYDISDDVKDIAIGHAALVYFYTSVQHNLETMIIDDVPVCHINLTQRACYQSVANPEHSFVKFLKEKDVYVSDKDYDIMKHEEEPSLSGVSDIDDTKSEDCITALSVDTTAKKIYITRRCRFIWIWSFIVRVRKFNTF